MRLPRLTTRRLMALVAVVALVLASTVTLLRHLISRGREFEGRAEVYKYGSLADQDCGCAVALPTTPETLRRERMRAYSARLYRKYRRAALYSWLPVPPDPPPPK
jgi:hypothetical protein